MWQHPVLDMGFTISILGSVQYCQFSRVNMAAECTIVGAGPVGCLMACYLSDLGFSCKIWEKRPDPRVVFDSGEDNALLILTSHVGKSINLALSCRGLTALSLLKEEDKPFLTSLQQSVPMPCRYIRLLGEPDQKQMYRYYTCAEFHSCFDSTDPSEYLHSVNRQQLNNDLITLAERRGVQITFDHPLVEVDFTTKHAIFNDAKVVRCLP